MNELQLFEHPQFGKVRVVEIDGEPWFIAADVCKALDLENVSRALSRLDEDEKNTITLSKGIPGNPKQTVVNEPGLYTLVLGSRKSEAKAFKRWITHEVLPSIRKHGIYATDELIDRMIGDPDMAIRMLQEIKEERRKVKALEKQAEEDRPKVLFADAVSVSTTAILVGDLAKLLRQNGMDIGQNRLFEVLRRDGFLIKDGTRKNMPTQRGMDMGLFRVKERAISNPDGTVRTTMTTLITGKGQQFFVERYLHGVRV